MAQSEPEARVFANELISSKIFSYCDCNSLKAARATSKKLNALALPIFRNKALMPFTITENFERDEEFSNKIATFKKLDLQKLKFTRHKGKLPEISLDKVKEIAKLFASCRGSISSIEIGFEFDDDFGDPNDYKNRALLLKNIFKQCTSLKELKINTFLSNGMTRLGVNKNVKVLKFAESWWMDEIDSYLKIFPNLEELCLCSENGDGQFDNFATYGEARVRKMLPNLKTLRITEHFQVSYPVSPATTMLNCLPLDLTTIELHSIKFCQRLSNSILRFSESLTTLILGVELRMGAASPDIHLPELRMLEKIKFKLGVNIFLAGGDKRSVWEFIWGEKENCLPKLKVAEVESYEEEDGEVFMNNFLVERNRKQFRNLELAFVSYGERRSKNFWWRKIKNVSR